jgi:hypothetical protein
MQRDREERDVEREHDAAHGIGPAPAAMEPAHEQRIAGGRGEGDQQDLEGDHAPPQAYEPRQAYRGAWRRERRALRGRRHVSRIR